MFWQAFERFVNFVSGSQLQKAAARHKEAADRLDAALREVLKE